jgi:hypothetical protein
MATNAKPVPIKKMVPGSGTTSDCIKKVSMTSPDESKELPIFWTEPFSK